MGLKVVSQDFQLGPQLDVVVYFAVEDDEVTSIRSAHRLPAGLGKIENRQPAMEKNGIGLEGGQVSFAQAILIRGRNQPTMIVRAPMAENLEDRLAQARP